MPKMTRVLVYCAGMMASESERAGALGVAGATFSGAYQIGYRNAALFDGSVDRDADLVITASAGVRAAYKEAGVAVKGFAIFEPEAAEPAAMPPDGTVPVHDDDDEVPLTTIASRAAISLAESQAPPTDLRAIHAAIKRKVGIDDVREVLAEKTP